MIGLLKEPLFHGLIRLKGNSKRTSANSLSHLGAQYKDLGAADVVFPARTFPKASSCVLLPRKEDVSPPTLHVRGKRTIDEVLRTSAFEAIADVTNRVKNKNLRGRVTTNTLNIILVFVDLELMHFVVLWL